MFIRGGILGRRTCARDRRADRSQQRAYRAAGGLGARGAFALCHRRNRHVRGGGQALARAIGAERDARSDARQAGLRCGDGRGGVEVDRAECRDRAATSATIGRRRSRDAAHREVARRAWNDRCRIARTICRCHVGSAISWVAPQHWVCRQLATQCAQSTARARGPDLCRQLDGRHWPVPNRQKDATRHQPTCGEDGIRRMRFRIRCARGGKSVARCSHMHR